MIKFVCDKKENTVGKGGNGGYQHFLPFPTVFSKCPVLRVLILRDFNNKMFMGIFNKNRDSRTILLMFKYTMTKKKCRVHKICNIIILLLGVEY